MNTHDIGRFDGAAPRIAKDRIPVNVHHATNSEQAWEKARAVLTMPDDTGIGRFLVWSSPSPQNPDVDTTWTRDESTIGRANQPWVIATPDGDYHLDGAGCAGCSPLAHMPWPWATYRMGNL